MKNTEIELRHIQLEIKNQRGQHLRHFVDQWFCYKHGYVNSNGRAKWSNIRWKEYVSKDGDSTRDKDLTIEKEHIVPLKVITKKLLELGKDVTIKQIELLLEEWLMFSTITHVEDKILNSNGVREKMPDEFYDENHELYGDKFARYKVCGIEIFKNKK